MGYIILDNSHNSGMCLDRYVFLFSLFPFCSWLFIRHSNMLSYSYVDCHAWPMERPGSPTYQVYEPWSAHRVSPLYPASCALQYACVYVTMAYTNTFIFPPLQLHLRRRRIQPETTFHFHERRISIHVHIGIRHWAMDASCTTTCAEHQPTREDLCLYLDIFRSHGCMWYHLLDYLRYMEPQ